MKVTPIETPQIMRAAPSASAAAPSSGLLTAALAGLLSVGLSACEDDKPAKLEDAGEEITPWGDAGRSEADEEDEEADASDKENSSDGGAAVEADAGAADEGDAAASGAEILSEVEGNVSFALLQSDCDARGGYIQVHASCSGSNDCAGFSYGDWDPGVLSEHTCAAANGCVGLSCVVLPEDSGKTGEEILFDAETLPAGGPQPCWFCHAESQHQADGSYLRDKTKFKVWVPEGSTRTTQNWLDLSPAAQEAIVAFGKIGLIGAPGNERAVVSMKGYHKLYSRAEVQRVVAHLRTLTPIIQVVKSPP